MTPRERTILRVYFAADMNAKEAAHRLGRTPERVRRVVRQVQAEENCTRLELAHRLDLRPPRKRRVEAPPMEPLGL
jgi:Sigma-70, region 4